MNMIKKIGAVLCLSFALLFVIFAGGSKEPTNCYTVVVGKNASTDGSVIVGHNEDDSGNIIVNLRKIKARDYGAPQKVSLGRGAVYETDGKTNEFLWIEATTQEFADSFVNQYGVLVTSDSCSSKETKADVTDGGIGYMLRRFIAEKARSAREAVNLAAELVEKYGYTGSGRTYTIADKNEAWMLQVIRGRHWMAERIPDDEMAVIPNHYTIREIDLNDKARFLGSRDIVAYAKENGWYDEAKDGRFDFKRAFSRPGGVDLVMDRNTLRHWRGLNYFSDKKWEIADTYPFSFKPGKKVAAESIMAVLRDHYEGTEYDATDGYKQGTPNRTKFRCICTASTINSFIASLKAGLPDPISVSLWLAIGKPDTTVYLPLYYGVESLPPGAGLGADIHDYAAFYKQHFDDAELKAKKDALLHTKILALQNIAEADYARMRGVIDKELLPAEREYIANRKNFESEVSALYAKDKAEARRRLTAYVAAAFEKVGAIYDRLLKKQP
jgi:dipeptidase